MIRTKSCVFCNKPFPALRGNQKRCRRCAKMMGTWGVKNSELNIQGGRRK